jgi:hypothetical protein
MTATIVDRHNYEWSRSSDEITDFVVPGFSISSNAAYFPRKQLADKSSDL